MHGREAQEGLFLAEMPVSTPSSGISVATVLREMLASRAGGGGGSSHMSGVPGPWRCYSSPQSSRSVFLALPEILEVTQACFKYLSFLLKLAEFISLMGY